MGVLMFPMDEEIVVEIIGGDTIKKWVN